LTLKIEVVTVLNRGVQYDLQVDLEAFSSQEFYKILTKQSQGVTSTIGMQKEEVKSLYQKVAQQTQSLKG